MMKVTIPTRLALLATLIPLLAGGCAGMDIEQTMGYAKAAGQASAAIMPVSLEEEAEIGQAVAARVTGRYGVLNDPALTEYVNLVGLVCAANAGRDGVTYRFAILNSDEVNAFAAPGGYIFITRGALKDMENEAQLAGVLSHEIAHTDNKHILNEIRKGNLKDAGVTLAETSGNIPAGLVSLAADYGANVLFKGYSRKDEYEADREGTAILHRAGYPADGLLQFLGRLDKGKGKGSLEILMSTHPVTGERITRVKKEIKTRGFKSEGRPYLAERFRKKTG
jgi:predicted Zn-dependent protease